MLMVALKFRFAVLKSCAYKVFDHMPMTKQQSVLELNLFIYKV
jgi:hypothetical protein